MMLRRTLARTRGARTASLRPWALALAAMCAVALASCGGSNDEATGGGSGGGGGSAEAVDAAAERVEALYRGDSFAEPPAESPRPAPNQNVWIVSTSLELPASAIFNDGAKAAARTMGWDITVFDGKFSSDRYLEGIRQAIADNADGILVYNVDCALVQPALAEARRADVPVVATESTDCDEAKQGAPSLFDASIVYEAGDGSFRGYFTELGRAQADWVIANGDGDSQVIVLKMIDLSSSLMITDGFVDQIESECPDCEIVRTVEFTGADLGPPLQEKVAQALLQHPDADAMEVAYDDIVTAGVAPAIMSSGRNDSLDFVAGGGFEPNLDLVRSNRGQDAGYAIALEWEGYAAMDTLNRVLNDETPVSSGIGISLFDEEHNLPASGSWQPEIDYAAKYRAAWLGEG